MTKVLLTKGNTKDKDIEIYQRQDNTGLINIYKGLSKSNSDNKSHYTISYAGEEKVGMGSKTF